MKKLWANVGKIQDALENVFYHIENIGFSHREHRAFLLDF